MLFSNSLKVPPNHVTINDTNLIQVDNTKFLGLYIDKDLTWKTHINYLCKILSRNTGVLSKLKEYFPTHILLSLYQTLIAPNLNYGILAWGNSSKFLLDSLLRIQKRAIRIINKVCFWSHTYDLFVLNKI